MAEIQLPEDPEVASSATGTCSRTDVRPFWLILDISTVDSRVVAL
jgi:hypothetical protein